MASKHGDPNRALDAAQFSAEVVQRKKAGLTFKEIGDELDRAPSYIHRVFWKAIRAIPEPAVAEYRAEQLARIAMEREVLLDIVGTSHATVSNGHIVSEITGRWPLKTDDGEDHPLAGQPTYGDPLTDPGPVMQAVDRLIKLDDQEMKVLGGYPASKLDLGGSVEITVNGVDPKDVV